MADDLVLPTRAHGTFTGSITPDASFSHPGLTRDDAPFQTENRDAAGTRSEFRLAIDTIPALVWTARPDGYVDFLNQRWCEYTGLTLEQAVGWGWQNALCPEDLPDLLETWRGVLASGAPGEAVARLRRADGVDRWFLFRAVPLYDATGALVKWYGQTTDIEDRMRAEALLAGEKRVLEIIAQGSDLPLVLDTLCRLAEEMLPGRMASILLLDKDGKRLWYQAAPSLPAEFVEAIVGSPIGTDIGPCGTAAYLVEPIIVPDIALETRWERFRGLAFVHGLQACWSIPIVSLEGTVLGAFAVYSREVANPSPQQRNTIDQLVSLASVGIARSRTNEALQRSEAYQAEAQRLSLTGSFSWNLRSGEVTWSDEVYRIYGHDKSIKPTLDLARGRVHPGDVPLFKRAEERAQEGANIEFAHRLLMPDGSTKYLQIVSRAIRDEAGQVFEYVGAVRDITEQKRAERALRRARVREIESQYNAMMEERTRLAREIHDTVLQGFNGVTLMLLAAAGKVQSPPEAIASLQHVLDLAEKTLGDARRVVWDLRGPSPSGGFASALRAAADDALRGTGLSLEFITRGIPRAMDPKSEAVAFRVMQEAIANTLKHAAAHRVRVCLSYLPRGLRLSVRDDGRGFTVDPSFHAYGGHWGLLGMWERASQVAGKLKVRSKPGEGTEISLRLA